MELCESKILVHLEKKTSFESIEHTWPNSGSSYNIFRIVILEWPNFEKKCHANDATVLKIRLQMNFHFIINKKWKFRQLCDCWIKWSFSFKGDNFKQGISIWWEQIVHLGCKSSLALVWIWFWRWSILQRSKPGLPEKYWSRYFGIFQKFWFIFWWWVTFEFPTFVRLIRLKLKCFSTSVVSNSGNIVRPEGPYAF